MYSLVFYLVKARRRRSASAQSRMLGVIAYAKTFQAICGVDDMSYHLDNLVESITSKHQEYNARDMAKSSTRSLIYSIVLGASAILIALSNFISIRETKYPRGGPTS